MINKIYKTINNKFLNVFKFIFFIRYVFAVFLIAISTFLLIPKFFDYEKKMGFIEEYLIKHYNLELNSYNKIEFKVFPTPNLLMKNVDFKINNNPVNLKSERVNIFLDLKSIYNYKKFEVKKIILKKSDIFLKINDAKYLLNYFNNLKNKLNINILNINFIKKDKEIFKIKNISLSNYGYRKYYINGEIFSRKFKASLKNDNQNLNFKLLKTGIKANFNFNDEFLNNLITGSSKINFSNNLLKFDFNLDNNNLIIKKSSFRNKDLSFSLDSVIKFNPYFNTKSNIVINKIDKDLIKNFNLENIIKKREIIRKLNSKLNINYKSKSYFTDLIEEYSTNLDISYGRLIFSNIAVIAGGKFNCQGDVLLTDQYPRLNFLCALNLNDKKKLLKKFSINKNIDNEPLDINVEGSLNLFSKKINLKKIDIENKYQSNKEDLQYFKDLFEDTLFDDGFFQIFNKSKIKEFLLEII